MRVFSEKHKEKLRKNHWSLRPNAASPFKGQKHSKKAKEKIRLAHLGKKQSEETIEKIKQKNIGLKRSKETRLRMSIAQKKIGNKPPVHKGENCHFWKGGIAYLSYSPDWTNELRIAIRERDHYICRLCNKRQGDKAFPVHHIDYNKKNCDPKNLITLCINCHMKTNVNREKWIKIFRFLIDNLCI